MNTKQFSFILGIFLFVCLISAVCFAPFLTHEIPGTIDISQRLLPPSLSHWLGTDLKGIDLWTSLLYGGRLSLMISFTVVCISTVIGTSLGLIAGYYYTGWFDQILMRCIDVLIAFPGMILTLVLASILAPTSWSLILTISLTAWIGPTRLIRGEVLRLREREYIVAAQALGVRDGYLLIRHLLPALFPLIFSKITTSIASVILIESGLSFLGLGPRGKIPTWGQLLSEGRTVIMEAPLLTIAPGMAIFLMILSINLIGDELRHRFDPKQV